MLLSSVEEGIAMIELCGVRIGGPLAQFAAGIEKALVADGYSGEWARLLAVLTAEVSCWLEVRGLQADDLSGELVGKFFAKRGSSRSRCRTARSFRPVMDHLRSVGAVGPEPTRSSGRTAAEVELLERYRCWCVTQRGLTLTTVDQYVRRVAVFLALWRPDSDVVIAELDGRAVLATIRAAGDAMPSPSLRCLVTAVRSFLRFLHVAGEVSRSLVADVPALRAWPRTALPTVLAASDARRLMDGCDSGTTRGVRDAAVVFVLLRLGLRASEVTRLALDDIDWRAGEVTINGKGGRRERMPLPAEVGEAIAAYVRSARPPSSSRSLFLTVVAPIRPLSCDAVGTLVYRACARAGVGRVGPHALRRTLATETLRAGAPMLEVAQLLRHIDQATSSIYAAADVAAVAALAQPWPGWCSDD
jgi:integrase/recombinase XerD